MADSLGVYIAQLRTVVQHTYMKFKTTKWTLGASGQLALATAPKINVMS